MVYRNAIHIKINASDRRVAKSLAKTNSSNLLSDLKFLRKNEFAYFNSRNLFSIYWQYFQVQLARICIENTLLGMIRSLEDLA